MNRANQPSAEMIEQVRDIPLYQRSIASNHFPILEKPRIAEDFPRNWMTPRLAQALESGAAECVLSTGTHHARMQIIRPPYFLLKSYYRLWSEHPEIGFTWHRGCPRVSLTTMLATEHVARVHARQHDHYANESPVAPFSIASRQLDARTLYLNQSLDPARWQRAEIEQMLADIDTARRAHPDGLYHLDCSSYHLAHFVLKLEAFGLSQRFPAPASIVHAYEYTPRNVRRFLQERFTCPIVDLFGSTELGYLFYSDKHGRYTPYLDKMSLELVEFAPGSGIYSLIVSSVRNPFMPLIRYRSGDCVQTSDASPDPDKITRFCGREKEMLETPRGVVSQADVDDVISAASPGIFVYQLQRSDADTAHVRYTTFDGKPISATAQASLRRRVVELTGLGVAFEHRAHIAIGKSGKYAWLPAVSVDAQDARKENA
jgi:phenylacetate-CoA ligase